MCLEVAALDGLAGVVAGPSMDVVVTGSDGLAVVVVDAATAVVVVVGVGSVVDVVVPAVVVDVGSVAVGFSLWRARSYAHLGYPLIARAFLMRSSSLFLFSSVDGMRLALRVSERIVASLWLRGAWDSNGIYWLVWVGFL